ncbi:MAG: hypothetical protein BGN83_07095 [Rhizobium sp. 63-7]|nr:MAG: hypothetical protein BGN83_07095 [Rhizobium sp. 63-7]
MRHRTGLPLILVACLALTSTARAASQNCEAWTAGLEDDEGGPTMTASVCNSRLEPPGQIRVQCGGEGALMLRYLPGGKAPYPGDGFETDANFTDGTTTVVAHLLLEAMDGALTTAVTAGSPLEALLAKGSSLTIAPARAGLKQETFTLKKSSAALSKLKASCR